MTDKKLSNDLIAAEVVKAPVDEWLSEQYGIYTLYVLRDRAIVNIDGLKPVTRRILYSFLLDGVTPTSEYVKSARLCASTMRFHPHGNSSIEGTAAAMAQQFTTRVPLTDPHGSVGKTHGDQPAAARYLELRLTRAAMELVKEVTEGAVPMGKNFDGSMDEPHILPVRWPEHIINGSQGIAVGYAAKMFAHNPDETMNALIKLVKNPDLTVEELLKVMPGPDLPTGGELLGVDGVKDYYETGKGGFTIRSHYKIENLSRGRTKITFYEIPFQVSPESVIERVKVLQNNGKLKEISSIKDLSDLKHAMRLVVETKAGTNSLLVINTLFKETNLEQRYSVNNTVLVDDSPVLVPMLTLLKNFVDFRRQCTKRKAGARIEKIDARLHHLAAILAVLVDIDKCISIIRGAETVEEARTQLMTEFSIDSQQAEYILSMQLRRLTKADALAINKENEALIEEKAKMQEILDDSTVLDAAVIQDLQETKKIISSERRTVITGLTVEEVKANAKASAQAARDVEKNLPCYLVRFADGSLLKTQEEFSYGPDVKVLEHGPIVEQLKIKTQDDVVLVGSNGVGYRVPSSYIPMDAITTGSKSGAKYGEHDRLVAIGKTSITKFEVGLVLASKFGEAKLVKPDFPNREEFPVFNLQEGDELVNGYWLGRAVTGSVFVSITKTSNILVYKAESLRLTGANAGGVKSQKLMDAEDEVIYFGWVQASALKETMIASQSQMAIKVTPLSEIPAKSKGSQGVNLQKFKKGDGKLVNAYAGANLLMSVKDFNKVLALPPATKRSATGADFRFPVHLGEATVAAF